MAKKEAFTKEEAEEEVKKMANLCGLIFYHFANLLVEKFGEEAGTELVKEAVKRFGLERGNKVREEVLRRGLKLTLKNFGKFSDLPKIGWGGSEREKFCPLAEIWIAKGAEDLCKLYCEVDFWKIKSYNPKIKSKRVKWVLEGDDSCAYEMKEAP
jgi:hypothetical protein